MISPDRLVPTVQAQFSSFLFLVGAMENKDMIFLNVCSVRCMAAIAAIIKYLLFCD